VAARVLLELILAVAIIVAILYGAYRYAAARQAITGPHEVDVSRVPSTWFTDSRTTDDGFTEVCIVRVEDRSGTIRERRVLSRLDNSAASYSEALDKAMDAAYAAMRVANVNLHRR
jgi:hypothetical protein